MVDSYQDAAYRSRTKRSHTGETMKHSASLPGYGLIFVAVLAYVVGLTNVAMGQSNTGITAMLGAALTLVVGGAWVTFEHRRVRGVEQNGTPKPTNRAL